MFHYFLLFQLLKILLNLYTVHQCVYKLSILLLKKTFYPSSNLYTDSRVEPCSMSLDTYFQLHVKTLMYTCGDTIIQVILHVSNDSIVQTTFCHLLYQNTFLMSRYTMTTTFLWSLIWSLNQKKGSLWFGIIYA